jgi:hypothetical protein
MWRRRRRRRFAGGQDIGADLGGVGAIAGDHAGGSRAIQGASAARWWRPGEAV